MNEQSHQTNHNLKIRDAENSASLQTRPWRRDWFEQSSIPLEIEKWVSSRQSNLCP